MNLAEGLGYVSKACKVSDGITQNDTKVVAIENKIATKKPASMKLKSHTLAI